MKKIIRKVIFCLPFSITMQSAVGFELLTEGDMGSVSASTVGHSHEFDPYEGDDVNGRYELMPFEATIQIDHDDTDEVSLDMEKEFAVEVDAWAVKLQERQSYQNEISTTEAIQVPTIENFEVDEPVNVIEQITEISLGRDTDNIRFLQGKVTQSAELLEEKEDSVRYTVESFVERAATINANPFQEEHTFGSTFISNLKSMSNVTITAK